MVHGKLLSYVSNCCIIEIKRILKSFEVYDYLPLLTYNHQMDVANPSNNSCKVHLDIYSLNVESFPMHVHVFWSVPIKVNGDLP